MLEAVQDQVRVELELQPMVAELLFKVVLMQPLRLLTVEVVVVGLKMVKLEMAEVELL
jgi:hypothetical protein